MYICPLGRLPFWQIYNIMNDFTPSTPSFHPIVSLLFLIGFFFLGSFAGLIVGFICSIPFQEASGNIILMNFMRVLRSDLAFPSSWIVYMFVQAFSSAGGFMGGALTYWFLAERRTIPLFQSRSSIQFRPLILIALLGLAFIVFNEWVYQWNRNWDLPDMFSGFENWSRKTQKMVEEMTHLLTQFDSFGKMLIGLLVIAVIPAVGEELMFRGMLQPILIRSFKNTHVAIWVTGIIFSFIHFQLDGFVPRMLLGVVFGYLYVWSGNIWYPIWAHFINNGVTVIIMYLYQLKYITINPENVTGITLMQGIAALLVSTGLLWYLHRSFQRMSLLSLTPAEPTRKTPPGTTF